MKKLTSIIAIVLLSGYSIAQNKKVGIETSTPTELLDLNGTMRVRTLPADSDYKKNAAGAAGGIAVVNSNNTFNVVGKTDKAEFVPNKTTSNFNTSNSSSAMFVIKRFKLADWPSGSLDKGVDTTMSSSIWIAVMSNMGFNFDPFSFQNNTFKELHLHSWSLVDNGTTWRIWGDINGGTEKSDYVDVLFIKKSVVAQEARTQSYPFNGAGPISPTP